MLTFNPSKKGFTCIGKIEGGKHDGKKLYLGDMNAKSKGPASSKYTVPKEGILKPVPKTDGRSVCYVAGPSGSGKSTWASNYISFYKKMYPETDFVLVSRVEEDEALDKLKPIRVPIKEISKDGEPYDIFSELEDGDIILFDDTDTIQDNKIKKIVSGLKNDILETGRHANITCIITSHLINGNDRKDTRTVLNECHNMVIFPKAGNVYGINYALKNYWGLPKKEIDKIMELPSRWVMLSKIAPQYVMHEKGAYLL